MEIGPFPQRLQALTGIRPCRGEILAALSRILDYDPAGHIPHHARVAVIAARMASHMRQVDRLDAFYGGLIHDIGLQGTDHDFRCTGNLEEQANQPLVRAHTLVGAQMAGAVPELATVSEMILDHHECVNGRGYPRGKAGQEIHLGAQLLRFADTCDFVLREQGWPDLISFLDAIRRRSAGQVDIEVADAGIEILGETGFYAQLMAVEDVELLLQSTIRHLAAEDTAATEDEVTSLLELFACVTDMHASDRIGHSRRVARFADVVATALGLPSQEITKIRWAALVHDIGMAAVPKKILDKTGPLTPAEMAIIHGHSVKTAEFMAPIRGLEDVAAMAAAHGEAFDGSGYPHGLVGNEIPLGSRILGVCCTFDALTSRRPYREARDTSLAIDILIRGSGGLFDPDVVSAAVPALLAVQSAEEPLTSLV